MTLPLPSHIALAIEHQPHAVYNQSIAQWLEHAREQDLVIVSDYDREEMLRTGQVWFVQWYPRPPTVSAPLPSHPSIGRSR